MVNKTFFENEGYCIIQNAYKPEEIKALRRILNKHFKDNGNVIFEGKAQPDALNHIPELKPFIFNDNIINAMKELLGAEVMFTFHSDAHQSIKSAWHKDDGTTPQNRKGYFDELAYQYDDCKVVKVGLYLQNHVNNMGGLNVRSGSHREEDLSAGEAKYLPTKAGDAVLFDVRINHAGQMNATPYPLINKVINRLRFNKQKAKKIHDKVFGDRYAIFFTYGLNNPFTITFSKNNMKRQLSQNQTDFKISDEMISVLREKQLLNPFET